jgi:hypothetical protein
MTTNEIRDLISKGRIERAIETAKEITASTDLENIAVGISSNYRTYKRKTMSGILSAAEERQEHALLTNRLLDLISEYEILEIKNLKSKFEKFREELQKEESTPEIEQTINELDTLKHGFDEIESANTKDDIEPNFISKIGQFIEKFNDPNTTEGKVLQGIKTGVGIAKDLAKQYNSIAPWFSLPHVPILF